MNKRQDMIHGAKTSLEVAQEEFSIGIPVECIRSSEHVHIAGRAGGGKSSLLLKWIDAEMKKDKSRHWGQ